jgi:hypothetical protein
VFGCIDIGPKTARKRMRLDRTIAGFGSEDGDERFQMIVPACSSISMSPWARKEARCLRTADSAKPLLVCNSATLADASSSK